MRGSGWSEAHRQASACLAAERESLLGRRCILGQELEKVLGHATSVVLLSGHLLSVLNHSYKFTEALSDELVVPLLSLQQQLQPVSFVGFGAG